MINIKQLKVMQNGFRLPGEEILKMAARVYWGGKFSAETLARYNPNRTSLIAITEFEDGQMFIRDGFHRVVAIIIGRTGSPVGYTGLKYGADLFEDEYVIEPMTYAMFLEINIENGWYTPFDPRTEVRKADFFDFKNEVLKTDKSKLHDFITQNKHRYAVPREPHHDPFKYADALVRDSYVNRNSNVFQNWRHRSF